MKYICIILSMILFGCKERRTSFSTEAELHAYLGDPANGYIQSGETDDLLVECRLVPGIQNDKHPQITFQLRLSRKDGGAVLNLGNVSREEALQREGYLSFEVQPDVFLESGEKTIPAIFSHYERNYGLKPSVDIMFRFENFSPQEDVYLHYRDQLFGQGLTKIKFDKQLFTTFYVSE